MKTEYKLNKEGKIIISKDIEFNIKERNTTIEALKIEQEMLQNRLVDVQSEIKAIRGDIEQAIKDTGFDVLLVNDII